MQTICSRWSTGLSQSWTTASSILLSDLYAASSGSAKLVLKARPGQKNAYASSSRIWVPFPCFPIQCDCYYTLDPVDNLLLRRKGGNRTWVDERRQVSPINSCEWQQKAKKRVRREKWGVLNTLQRGQNPILFGWWQFYKNTSLEKTNNQNKNKKSKTPNIIIQVCESNQSQHASRELGFFCIRSVCSSFPSTWKIILPSCQSFFY